ncbi:hypothetical protein PHYPO_G00078140 [Pangasianodon hypophthalmus]|uniref:Uncharacterized protein n=1 Tax=Pangasianodon hypophthalmus TaxID=310915 RepID=A0A5N5LN04_PANHP|nr:hypothetical protein PHYPO_G00078140 [Pangasianodon hypophthalmus]
MGYCCLNCQFYCEDSPARSLRLWNCPIEKTLGEEHGGSSYLHPVRCESEVFSLRSFLRLLVWSGEEAASCFKDCNVSLKDLCCPASAAHSRTERSECCAAEVSGLCTKDVSTKQVLHSACCC